MKYIVTDNWYRIYDRFSNNYKEVEFYSKPEDLEATAKDAYWKSDSLFDKSPSVVIESLARGKGVEVSRGAIIDAENVWNQVAQQLIQATNNYSFAAFDPYNSNSPRITFAATKETFTELLKHKIYRNEELSGKDLIIECTSKDCLGKSALVRHDEIDSSNLFDRILK